MRRKGTEFALLRRLVVCAYGNVCAAIWRSVLMYSGITIYDKASFEALNIQNSELLRNEDRNTLFYENRLKSNEHFF